MNDLLKSKKFRAALLAAAVAGVAQYAGMSQATIWQLISPLLAYIGMEGVADFKKRAPVPVGTYNITEGAKDPYPTNEEAVRRALKGLRPEDLKEDS